MRNGEAHGSREYRAREYAKEWLRYYVEHGFTVARVCEIAHVHAHALLYTVQIGGVVYFEGKLHCMKASQVVIKAIDEQPCLYAFDVAQLFQELGAAAHTLPVRQPSLWEECNSNGVRNDFNH